VVGIGYDKRIGSDFLRPGPGWGGSCFPKDSKALLKIAEDHGYRFDLLAGVVAVNDEQFDRMADKVAAAAGGELAGKRIAVWGLTFKAGTDDLRDSPSAAIIARLLAAGAQVVAFDPTVTSTRPGVPTGIELAESALDACRDADVLAVLTEWDEFRWIDAAEVAGALRGDAVVDTRNLLERTDWQHAGLRYVGVGR
jgi:UDPglucose 6-dehydrogenase